jgi:glycosyltransferase involved in cell wall biosynthesis
VNTFARSPETLGPAIEALRALVAEVDPGVVHAHAGVPATALALALPRSASRPRFVAHMYSWGEGRPAWMNEMDLAGFRQADRVVCSARRYEEILIAGGVERRRLAYIPWGVSAEAIDRARARARGARRADGRVHIGFVGRVEPRKGQLELIAAFDTIRRRTPNVHLNLVGPEADTGYAARCRAEIDRRRLQSHVTWHGYVKSAARVLVDWQLFISLSSDEGQGLAVQEAMAARVPVLALTAPGIVDFLRDGVNGRLVRSRRAREVAAAAVDLLGDPLASAPMARAGARAIRTRYSWARCAAAIERLYR